jgi:hypothetical protein
MLRFGIALALLLPLQACSGGEEDSSQKDHYYIDAYHDEALFRAAYRELPPGSEAADDSISIFYESKPAMLDGGSFVHVLGGSVSNPVWRKILVSGNQCARDQICAVPRQYFSAAQILAAVGTEIHLVPTHSLCEVSSIRPKK